MKTVIRIIVCLALVVGVVTLAPEAYTIQRDTPVDFNSRTDTAPETVLIEQGISISGIDMSGKTREEAEALLNDYYRDISDGVLIVHAGSSMFSRSYQELGFSWEFEEELDSAMLMGQSTGRTIKKYKALSDMHAGAMDLYGSDRLDRGALRSFIREIGESVRREPVDATLTREDGRFIVTPGQKGVRLEEDKTYLEITAALAEFPERATATAVTDTVEQKVSYEMLKNVKDLLGTCSTYVNGTDNRAHNVALGASNINGLLLMPGESASASLLMEERTQENGYLMAGQYVDGQSVDTWGGGICQVSSTLYNALMKAEIQIDERHNHSMSVRYLDPSLDAAISWGTKDMRFTNNTDYPIYIEGWSRNRECTFNVYGCETRPANRTVKYVSVVDEEKYPEDVITYSADFPVGYTKKTSSGHPFIRSHMDKIVYIDGEQVSRETVHYDTYNSSPGKVIVGTAQPAPTPDTQPETTPAGG